MYPKSLITPLFVSDRHVEGMSRLPGPVTPPDAHERVQPVYHPVTSNGTVIDATATDLLISPDATDDDIIAVLADLGYPTQALIVELPADPHSTIRFHFFSSSDVTGATELIPLTT